MTNIQQKENIFRNPRFLGGVTSLLLLIKNLFFFWGFSYAFYPDSNLYVNLGKSFFSTWFISPLVTLQYPLLNAITVSYKDPTALMLVQILLISLVSGFLVYILAIKNWRLATITAAFLILDIVGGSLARSLLTDAIFPIFLLLIICLLILHYQRKVELSSRELIITGVIYAFSISIRPSHIFLIVLLPLFYIWLTHSWKKVFHLTMGILLFFSLIGLINLKGNGEFFILSNDRSYTNDYLAFPLFVYHQFSPDNGPASQTLDQYLQMCYPNLNYEEAVDRGIGLAFDSENNMAFITKQVMPCIETQKALHNENRSLFKDAYIEAFISHPFKYSRTIIQEISVFLKYGNPYILPWQLNASLNYGCVGPEWCDEIQVSHFQWQNSSSIINFYEKIATKLLQIYLVPVGLIAKISPEKQVFPVLFSWVLIALFVIIKAKDSERLLAILCSGLVLYTAAIVVAGLGFTERYAAMLAPIQTIFSALAWYIIGKTIVDLVKLIRRRTIKAMRIETTYL